MIRAYAAPDNWGMGVSIGLVLEMEDQPKRVARLILDGRALSWETIEEGTVTEPTLVIGDEIARALLDTLTRYYHGAEDTRALRRDYDAERKRVDSLIEHVTAIARTLAGD